MELWTLLKEGWWLLLMKEGIKLYWLIEALEQGTLILSFANNFSKSKETFDLTNPSANLFFVTTKRKISGNCPFWQHTKSLGTHLRLCLWELVLKHFFSTASPHPFIDFAIHRSVEFNRSYWGWMQVISIWNGRSMWTVFPRLRQLKHNTALSVLGGSSPR